MQIIHGKTGWIEVICGPMFSGKSEELIKRIRRAQIARRLVQIFKHGSDARYDATNIVSHSQQSIPGIAVTEVNDILEVTHHRYPKKEVLLLFYRCELRAGEVRHLQVADHAWVAPRDLDDYPLPPADERVVARIRAL